MFDVQHIIESGGILIICLIVFAESGLFIGFFLPGDTLLLSAGIFASLGKLPLGWLMVGVILAAIIGDNVGYSIGRRTGHRIFKKKDGIFFRREHIERAEKFYEKHGGKTIILARFTPIVRTFAPLVAGVGKMPRRHFMLYNIIGGILWGGGVTLLGYWFGSKIPHLDKYIHYVLIFVVVASLGLALFHLLKDKTTRKLLAERLRLSLRSVFLNKKID